MNPAQMWAQARRIGALALIGPTAAGMVTAVTGAVAARVWPASRVVVLVMCLAQLFVIIAGVCAVAALAGDPLVEVHEATPTGFRTVQFIRAALVGASGLCGAAAMFIPLHLQRMWPHDQGWATIVSPTGAVVIVTVVAMLASAFVGTTSATTIAVITGWLFLTMMWDPYVVPVLQQRGLPLLVCCGLLAAVWRRLADCERNITQAAAA